MRKDIASTFNLRTFGYAIRSFRAGFRQGKVQGDPFQQGGALAINPDGKILYQFASRAGGHHFNPQELLNSAKHLAPK